MEASSSKERKTMAGDFLEECWEHILKFLNTDYTTLKSATHVSKKFLSITNTTRTSLTISPPTLPFLHHHFQRFTHLTNLNLTHFIGDLNTLLCQISLYPLCLKSLNLSNNNTIPQHGFRSLTQIKKKLTSLVCSNIGCITKSDLFAISECFPFLEELNLSFPEEIGSDAYISSLTLPKLRKVNLSGKYYIDDSLFFNICKNCEFLEEIVMLQMFDSMYLTRVGVAVAINERPNLKSFSLSFPRRVEMYVGMKMIQSLKGLKGLTYLDLSRLRISEYLLLSFAEEDLPLKTLILESVMDCSYEGIYCLLSKCQFLQHLSLENTRFLNDLCVSELSLILPNLVSINLNHCYHLSESTLFALVRNCSLLNEIYMENTSIGKLDVEKNVSMMDHFVNPHMKSLHLARNSLNDEIIKLFPTICPNLELLDLSYSSNMSEYTSIVEILRSCCKIVHLNLTCCPRVKLLGMNFEVRNLEVLNLSITSVSRSRIDDITLYVISKSCSGLVQLDLQWSCQITRSGVKHIVENCTRLKEINLRYCCNLINDIDLWMSIILSRPSLRKIKTPSHLDLGDSKWKPLLDHGCFLWNFELQLPNHLSHCMNGCKWLDPMVDIFIPITN